MTGSPTSHRSSEAPNHDSTSAGVRPSATWSDSVTEPWRLASRRPSGPSTSGTWAWAGTGRPEQAGDEDLAGRGVEQVVAPHDLADAVVVVVDHHDEVVGRRAVGPADHEVVDRRR